MQSPTPRRPDRPILWIIAGPNGSGKSTLYNRSDIEGWGGLVWIINPDLLTAKIVEREGLTLEAANRAAVERIEEWLDASIDAYQAIGVETVLSSPKYRRLVERARERGFEVRMLYVVLTSADLQLARIRRRVAEGGHDVPPDKVVAPDPVLRATRVVLEPRRPMFGLRQLKRRSPPDCTGQHAGRTQGVGRASSGHASCIDGQRRVATSLPVVSRSLT